jgi:hypothetical protein
MSIEADSGPADRHALVNRKRDLIVQRLARALDALDRRRRMISAVVGDVASLLPGATSASASTHALAIDDDQGNGHVRGGLRPAIMGALAGGAVFALGLLVEHRRRERNRPLRVLQRTWFKYAMPPQPSLVSRLVTEAVGSLVLSLAQEAARTGMQRLLESRGAQDGDDGPEILDRVSDSPDPRFVSGPITVDPGAMRPREDTLPPAGIAPPDPIAPLPSPLREFA